MNIFPLRLLAVVAVGLASPSQVPAETPAPDSGQMPIDMNLAGLADWNCGLLTGWLLLE